MLVTAVPLAMLAAAAAAQSAPAPIDDQRIIVTGERVTRSIKDTASSVSVATRREIEAASADRVDQMLAQIPNVQLGGGSEGPAIRGQDTTGALQNLPAFLGGNRPRMTLIVDGRRQTYNEFVFGASPLWDIDRMEVFRSPQTTTQGQNSIAGAIFVTSNDPTFEPEARVRGMVGNYHMGELSASASAPLSGDVAFRFAGDFAISTRQAGLPTGGGRRPQPRRVRPGAREAAGEAQRSARHAAADHLRAHSVAGAADRRADCAVP